jgi:hypothetical protein
LVWERCGYEGFGVLPRYRISTNWIQLGKQQISEGKVATSLKAIFSVLETRCS